VFTPAIADETDVVGPSTIFYSSSPQRFPGRAIVGEVGFSAAVDPTMKMVGQGWPISIVADDGAGEQGPRHSPLFGPSQGPRPFGNCTKPDTGRKYCYFLYMLKFKLFYFI
jgi:hypothetical protein